MNDEQMASLFYGNTTPTAAPANTPMPATSDDLVAERLFGNADKPTAQANPYARRDDRPVEALSEAEQAQRMYGNTDPTLTHRDAVQAIVNAGMEQNLLDPEEAREIAGEWAETFALHNLNATESKDVADLGASVMANPPSEETMSVWASDAIQSLKTDFGLEGAGQALNDARAYVASVPGAADMLDATGLGNHPRIVALAAARGRAMRLAGKLR